MPSPSKFCSPVYARKISVRLTWAGAITAGAYSSGQCVGGVQALANAVQPDTLTGTLESIVVRMAANVTPAFTLLLFGAQPSGTYTDASAFSWTASDYPLLIAQHSVAATDFITSGSFQTASYGNLGKQLTLATTTLYALLVATGAFTPTGTNQLSIDLGIAQD